MSLSPKIAVVILNWNGKKFLEQFLPSVVTFSVTNAEIIVADNGSTDDSVAFIEQAYATVRVIRLNQNYGFAKGYNEALKQIQADYYVLLNSDVEVTKDWLLPMTALLNADAGIAACQPKILSYQHKNMFEYAGAAGGWIDKYGYPFAKGRIFDVCEEDNGQYDQAEPIFWASGAALFIRSAVFHEVGGFDEFFFAHQEEIDLCWRIQLAGHKIYACPTSVVYHIGGGTLPKGNSKKTWLNFRNNRIMLSKNLPWQRKLWVMPFRNLLDAVSAWKGLLSGDTGYFVAVIKAHVSFVKWWFFQKKKSVFPAKKAGPVAGMLWKNVAWLHFAKKQSTFTEIVGKTK
ncbi:MAG TPA: glycosyltransferase family 2 protein [Chitinophagaceae bacterium]